VAIGRDIVFLGVRKICDRCTLFKLFLTRIMLASCKMNSPGFYNATAKKGSFPASCPFSVWRTSGRSRDSSMSLIHINFWRMSISSRKGDHGWFLNPTVLISKVPTLYMSKQFLPDWQLQILSGNQASRWHGGDKTRMIYAGNLWGSAINLAPISRSKLTADSHFVSFNSVWSAWVVRLSLQLYRS